MHIQLLHTSASLAINENWDPDVRDDMEMMLNRLVPEDVPFRHSCEGPDDMVRQSPGLEMPTLAFIIKFFPHVACQNRLIRQMADTNRPVVKSPVHSKLQSHIE